MDGFDNLGDLYSVVLAVVALPTTSGIAAKDIFTLHPSECASTWWSFCWARFTLLLRLRLRLSFPQNRIHNQSSQPRTVDNCFKFIPCIWYAYLGESTLLELLSMTGYCLGLLRGIEFDFIFLYFCHRFLDHMVFVKIWYYIRIFIIYRNCCRNGTIRRLRNILEIQKVTFVLSFKESQIFIIFN